MRAILNYGHTLGHVVETLTGYGTYLQEAVGIGMRTGLLVNDQALERKRAATQLALLKRCGLPGRPELDTEAIRTAILRDKECKTAASAVLPPPSARW